MNDTHDRILRGHPWVFGNQITNEEGPYEPGDIVQVFDAKGRPLGQGYINPASLIRVRMLTPHVEERINSAFIATRVERARKYRQRMGYTGSCRMIFSEADQLPGLIVDKFNEVLSVQFLTLGMERWKEVILVALMEVVKPTGIYIRNDVPIREKEGLELYKGFYGKPFPTDLLIDENGLKLHVDVGEGQKTGHFLDQVQNHAQIARISAGQRVLDCFTHTGGFGLHAAKYGAAEVLGLDISSDAIAQATRNAATNELKNCRFQVANVFDHLTEMSRKGQQWDVIVLDPPAFAKSRGAIDNAYRGYKEINLRALKCIPSGGFLVTCSCSQHMTTDLFRKMITEAARDAGRRLREVYIGGQPPDHPVLWGVPETHYLKCFMLEVL